jgi:hypothetical protein
MILNYYCLLRCTDFFLRNGAQNRKNSVFYLGKWHFFGGWPGGCVYAQLMGQRILDNTEMMTRSWLNEPQPHQPFPKRSKQLHYYCSFGSVQLDDQSLFFSFFFARKYFYSSSASLLESIELQRVVMSKARSIITVTWKRLARNFLNFFLGTHYPPGEAREDFVFVPCNFLIPLVVVSPSITYVLQHEVVCHNTLLGLTWLKAFSPESRDCDFSQGKTKALSTVTCPGIQQRSF